MRKSKTFKVWKDPTKERLFYPEDLIKILNVASQTRDPKRNVLLIKMLAKIGCRISELRDIKVSDINFDKQIIKITRLKRRGKTKSKEFVPIDDKLTQDIYDYIKFYNLKAPHYIFFNPYDKMLPLSRKTLWYIVKRIGIKAGFPFLHPHTFRHNLVVAMREKGEKLTVIQKQLGHASIETTAQYDLVTIEDLRNAVKDMWEI